MPLAARVLRAHDPLLTHFYGLPHLKKSTGMEFCMSHFAVIVTVGCAFVGYFGYSEYMRYHQKIISCIKMNNYTPRELLKQGSFLYITRIVYNEKLSGATTQARSSPLQDLAGLV
jgi:hypothetical protein